MAEPATTCADPSTSGPEAEAMGWWLTLVHATDPRVLGRRRRLAPGLPLVLGRRRLAFGEGAPDDERISRAHLRLPLAEHVRLEDLGSHNGSFVDGRRVDRAVLDAGALVGLGRTLVLLQRGPAEPSAPLP